MSDNHPALQESLTQEEWDTVGRHLGLSPRELQLARCLFEDLSEAAIADQLCLSPHTVDTYSRRLKAKVGASTRAGVIVALLMAWRVHQTGLDSDEAAS